MNSLHFALRQLAKSSGFTTTAVLTLALGIGLNTAVFSVFKAQALAALPYPDAGRVVQLWCTQGASGAPQPWSVPDFFDLTEQATSLADAGAFRPENFTLGGSSPLVVNGIGCTSGVLRALATPPALGRTFSAEDEKLGAPATVILSHACWRTRFGGDRAVIGRTIRIDGQGYEVIGVMPPSFEFYCPWTGNKPIALWIPLRFAREGQFRGAQWLLVVGRLKPDVDVKAAAAELKVIAARLEAAHPDTNNRRSFYLRPLHAELMGRAVSQYQLVAVAVLLVLAAASANVAIMLLARGSGRQVEYAVRLALGASRGDLVRLALVESLVLALLGGAAGVLLTWNATELLAAIFVPFSTHDAGVSIDRGVLGFSLVLAVISSLAAGLPPALTAARTDFVATMKEGGATQAGSRARHRFLRRLVAAQVAMALAITNTALLMLANHRAALAFNEPLSSEYTLASTITLKGMAYRSGRQRAAFWEQLLERVQALPGVTTAAATTKLPLRGYNTITVLANDEPFDRKLRRPVIQMTWVSPNYFSALGLTQHAGRTLLATDVHATTPGAVVNRKLVETYWPGQDALGKTLRNNGPTREFAATVVGVVDDVRQWEIGHPAMGEMYLPFALNAPDSAHLVVRSAFDAHQLAPALRRELAALDPDLALAEPMTMAEFVSEAARGRRTLLALTNFFMVATLAMAAVGLYGTLSFQTRQRAREIGVRLALGASRRDITVLVLRQAATWLISGAVVGMLASVGIAFALGSFFADVRLINPSYYFAGLIVLTIVLLAACWLPARRAARVSPVDALRAE